MTSNSLIAAAVAGVLVVSGCAWFQSDRVDDKLLGRLLQESRARLLDSEKGVSIAEANLRATRSAESEAKRFEKIVATELDSAEQQLEANERSVLLAQDARDESSLTATQRSEELGRQRVRAREAKLDYAKRLQALRRAQVDEAEARLEHAQAQLELEQYRELKAGGMADSLDGAAYERAERSAFERVAKKIGTTSRLRAEMDVRHTNWEALRRQYDEEAARAGEVPFDAPPPPEPLTGAG